jgi:homocysteine S-methyltransferase
MAQYRHALPQLGEDLFLADGGLETTLIFHDGIDIPHFASFHLLKDEDGETAIRSYYATYAELARRLGVGVVLDSPTWRSSSDWGETLGYSPGELAAANRHAIALLEDTRRVFEHDRTPVVIGGVIGPRGDGYVADASMSSEQARDYHLGQAELFADTAADMISAITMNYVEEAEGLALAAQQANMPVSISFTVETDGTLPTGQPLREAVEQVDAATSNYPAYYMINCAHTSHFEPVLEGDDSWLERIRGLRANASRMSHAELDEAEELDIGDPVELGGDYARLKDRLPRLTVMGGCCGTDHRHIEEIATACLPMFRHGG